MKLGQGQAFRSGVDVGPVFWESISVNTTLGYYATLLKLMRNCTLVPGRRVVVAVADVDMIMVPRVPCMTRLPDSERANDGGDDPKNNGTDVAEPGGC